VSDLAFGVTGARVEPFAAVPTLLLRLRIEAPGGERIHLIALRCQILIEARQRHYSASEAPRLVELFGEPHRWGSTLRSMLWTHVPLMVGGFERATEVDVPITCTYDLEVASTRYFRSLDDGEIPLLLQFSGTVFTKGDAGFSVEQISWARETRYRLPVRVWHDLLERYFPGTGWIRLRRDSVDALQAFKSRRALPTWDDVVSTLLAEAGVAPEPVQRP